MSFFLVHSTEFSKIVARFSSDLDEDVNREQLSSLLSGSIKISDQEKKDLMQARSASDSPSGDEAVEKRNRGPSMTLAAIRQRELRAKKKSSPEDAAPLPPFNPNNGLTIQQF